LKKSGECDRKFYLSFISPEEESETMKCPHCGQNIGEEKCPSCGSEVFPDSLFCHRCGKKMERPGTESKPPEEEKTDFSKRVLCSDGTCIGVVNEQGFCKVCGKPYTGEPL
jgi:DNA-directed RNA polymerase subunit RPC12/RpoP